LGIRTCPCLGQCPDVHREPLAKSCILSKAQRKGSSGRAHRGPPASNCPIPRIFWRFSVCTTPPFLPHLPLLSHDLAMSTHLGPFSPASPPPSSLPSSGCRLTPGCILPTPLVSVRSLLPLHPPVLIPSLPDLPPPAACCLPCPRITAEIILHAEASRPRPRLSN
jgi:hypothetical protein